MIQKETKQKREKRKTLEDVRTKIEKKNQKKKPEEKRKTHNEEAKSYPKKKPEIK